MSAVTMQVWPSPANDRLPATAAVLRHCDDEDLTGTNSGSLTGDDGAALVSIDQDPTCPDASLRRPAKVELNPHALV